MNTNPKGVDLNALKMLFEHPGPHWLGERAVGVDVDGEMVRRELPEGWTIVEPLVLSGDRLQSFLADHNGTRYEFKWGECVELGGTLDEEARRKQEDDEQ